MLREERHWGFKKWKREKGDRGKRNGGKKGRSMKEERGEGGKRIGEDETTRRG